MDGNSDWNVVNSRLTGFVEHKNGVGHEEDTGNVDQENVAAEGVFNFTTDDEAEHHPEKEDADRVGWEAVDLDGVARH